MYISETVAKAASALDALILPWAEERVREKRSKAHSYYASRRASQTLFLQRELALVTKISEWSDAPKHIHEFGAGTLAVLFATLGFGVTCSDSDPGCAGLGAELLEIVARSIPGMRSRCRFRPQDFANQDEPPLPGTLALATKPALSTLPLDNLLQGLEAYDFILIASQTMASVAETAEARDQTRTVLAQRGFLVELLDDAELDTFYYFLRRQLLIEQIVPPFTRHDAYGWQARLSERFCSDGDNNNDQYHSNLWLLEDGAALGPPHSIHHDIFSVGYGRYSHWSPVLYFSTSDNSDPRLNGRTYNVVRQYGAANAGTAPDRRGAVVGILGDILKKRGVSEIVYFHTDHFEPWYGESESPTWWKGLDRFAKLTRGLRFGSKSSLFYKPFLPYGPRRLCQSDHHFLSDDGVAFFKRSPQFLKKCREHLAPLEIEGGHEFHFHVHHEGWTTSDCVHPDLVDWMKNYGSPLKDSNRFDFFLGLCRKTVAEEIGRDFDHWAFIHGHWSLNASNPAFCRIVDELAILQRHGCYGDFTFPAGEFRCDPAMIEAPFTCDALSIAKCYDHPEASPRPLREGAGDMDSGRFLVWNSPIKGNRSSLDFFSPNNLALFAQPEFLLRDWLTRSVVIKNCLYIKTHAHSMHESYRLWDRGSFVPHTFPSIGRLFDLLERVTEHAKVPITTLTVNEVHARLAALDRGNARLPEGPRLGSRLPDKHLAPQGVCS